MSKTKFTALDAEGVSAIRSLVIDMTNAANSGHPGMALDAAPIAYVLFKEHLISDPKKPEWFNRDRFVLSAGHASPLLYATLHLAGYDLPLEEIKRFRQLGSETPGHPEYGWTPGVDATGGPLGQGVAQAVGMAMAEKAIQAQYPEGEKLCSHRTYCLCGDGCLQEGISQEAISLAGHLGLSKLTLIYDQNTSTLDGPTSNSFSEDVGLRFKASGWDVLEVEDGNDLEAIDSALNKAKETDKPTIIIVHTLIGFGSAHQGSHVTHGAPLGKEDGDFAKSSYGWEKGEFEIPSEVYSAFAESFAKRGRKAREEYEETIAEYAKSHEKEYGVFLDAIEGNIESYIPKMPEEAVKKDASRNTSGTFVSALHDSCPFTFGGAADVASSVKTKVKNDPNFSAEHPEGRNVNWGIREFAMAACNNGILLHKGLRSYGGCFLVFSDYMKNAIRMASLQHLPAIFLFSHDSIAVGEDGPTHEPIEQLAALRSMPNLNVLRPADARESWACWEIALKSKHTPSALILSRQGLPLLDNSSDSGCEKGAYLVYGNGDEEYQLIATGSEVSLAIEAAKLLKEKGLSFSVTSMPSMEIFERQDKAYKKEVLYAPYEKRVSLEMLSTFGWGKYAKVNIGLDEFGKSAPASVLLPDMGFTPEKVASSIIDGLKDE
ncbi:MAG: transketolase [Bacillota bacterium]|nr:transketolase [Bacillota bacterium]